MNKLLSPKQEKELERLFDEIKNAVQLVSTQATIVKNNVYVTQENIEAFYGRIRMINEAVRVSQIKAYRFVKENMLKESNND